MKVSGCHIRSPPTIHYQTLMKLSIKLMRSSVTAHGALSSLALHHPDPSPSRSRSRREEWKSPTSFLLFAFTCQLCSKTALHWHVAVSQRVECPRCVSGVEKNPWKHAALFIWLHYCAPHKASHTNYKVLVKTRTAIFARRCKELVPTF